MESVETQTEQSTQTEPKDEEISLGIDILDEMLESASNEAVALAYGCLEIYLMDQRIGEKIREKLRSSFEAALTAQSKNDPQVDLECDLLPCIKWQYFLQGYMTGRGLVTI